MQKVHAAAGRVLSNNMAEVGNDAPDFSLEDQDGKQRKLSEFRGKKVLLSFYPFDFSPVCTAEFKCFQEDLSMLNEMDAQVLGISVDSKWSHKEFAKKHGLNFLLLADFGREVSKMYGTLRKEGFSDRAYFILDKEGKIRFKHVMPSPGERLENSKLVEELGKF
jgi:peroxiredoxin